MVNVQELKAHIVRNGYTQKRLASEIGMSEQSFTRKMKLRVFGTDEASKIVKILNIKDPEHIFLC